MKAHTDTHITASDVSVVTEVVTTDYCTTYTHNTTIFQAGIDAAVSAARSHTQDSLASSNRSAWAAAASSETSASSRSAFTSQESKGKPLLV